MGGQRTSFVSLTVIRFSAAVSVAHPAAGCQFFSPSPFDRSMFPDLVSAVKKDEIYSSVITNQPQGMVSSQPIFHTE
jgi:hypothetical protein